LALANLLNAAAELKIDVTPMEGFEPEAVNEILGLQKMGLNATLIATIGYRHEDDATQHFAKVRKSEEELFINL
jgi:nitroreductase